MKKLIEIPEEINQVLEQHKELTGRPTSSMIQEAIYRWLIHERLIVIKTTPIYVNKIEKEKSKGEHVSLTTEPPQEIMYCESESCQIKNLEIKEG